TEADLAEIDSTGGSITRVVTCDCASRVVLEARDASELRRVAVQQILIARPRRTTWCRARRRRESLRELRSQRARVVGICAQLRKEPAARLVLAALCALYRVVGDVHDLTLFLCDIDSVCQ